MLHSSPGNDLNLSDPHKTPQDPSQSKRCLESGRFEGFW